MRNGDHRYEFNLEQKYSDLRDGQFVYVWAKLWSDIRTESQFSVSCYSPLHLYVNGREAFRSNIMDESFPDRKNGVKAQLEPGWNQLCAVLYEDRDGLRRKIWIGVHEEAGSLPCSVSGERRTRGVDIQRACRS